MVEENGLISSQGPGEEAKGVWPGFLSRADELVEKLSQIYDESSVERYEYVKGACRGGDNFGKTLWWVTEYSPDPTAMESVASALEAIVNWPNAGSIAWEMRRFIKFSSAHGYDNVPDVVRFGDLIKKIGDDDPTNKKGFNLDMDDFYWASNWGTSSAVCKAEDFLRGHAINVADEINRLELRAHPEIIDTDYL